MIREPLVLITVAELRAVMADVVAEAIAKVGSRQESDVISRRQAAKLIGVHPRTLSKLVHREGLPLLTVLGKSWRFSRREVLAWVGARAKTE